MSDNQVRFTVTMSGLQRQELRKAAAIEDRELGSWSLEVLLTEAEEVIRGYEATRDRHPSAQH